MKCRHCGRKVGEFYSDLDTHLWIKHRRVMIGFLERQRKKEGEG